MLNDKSVQIVNNSIFGTSFRKPLYESYSFAKIPATIESLLGYKNNKTLPADVIEGLPQEYDKVVLFFIDAFGWRFFDKYKNKYPFLQRIIKEGVASKLTSQFPSTTAAHVTTIHTGERIDKSGVFEWFYYEPKLDAMIAPLLFSFAGKKERETLKATGVNPHELYPNKTFYARLRELGIKSYISQHKEILPSSYSDVVFAGADIINPYGTLPEALTHLSQALKVEKEKSYFFLYFDKIDGIGHKYGPNSPQFEAEVDSFFTTVERLFYNQVAGKCGKTLFLMTADHGQVDVDPTTTVYLNKEIPEITNWIKTNRKGELLVPAGSCRDMFLYIKDEYINEAIEKLTKILKGKSEVFKVEDLMSQGFFGDSPSELLKSRIGNALIVSYQNQSVWWYEEGKFEQRYYGHHGGLTPEEMETIFLALPL